MVVEMKKLNLVALERDRDGILNALERTGAVEVKQHAPDDFAHALSSDTEALSAEYNETETALGILTGQAAAYASAHKIKFSAEQEISLSYSEFMAAGKNAQKIRAVVEKINRLWEEQNALKAEINRLNRALKAAEVYEASLLPFSAYTSTAAVTYKLGVVERNAFEKLQLALEEMPLADYRIVSKRDAYVIGVCFYKTCKEEGEKLLSEAGFVQCPYRTDVTGKEQCVSLREKIAEAKWKTEENGAAFYALAEEIPALQIYSDYIRFELEKGRLSDKMLATERTFLLETYVPVTGEERVKAALSEAFGAVYYEFSPVPDDEMPPTLLKNNAVIDNFEAVTNMYSAPNAREFDPNTVMAFFYSLFMGFIMADIGYGLLMILGGGFLWWKNRDRTGGLKRLAGVFAIGGIFAVLWGFLFNSLFGIGILPHTVMPDAQRGTWTFVGIKVPSVLFIALEIGVVQLCAGYLCKAVQCWRRGQIADGILDGMVWAFFSVGVGMALIGLVEEANSGILATIGGITAAVMLVVAMLTAGRKEKLVGKFTKGFGAAYGVINYASDILSYARLYGLMLSGAVIAQIISQYAVTGVDGGAGMIASGNVALVILGVVLMIVGHVFNLALSLLGAYIHDARLQYVEFYGRFYEGEGELFAPLGSDKKYVRVR